MNRTTLWAIAAGFLLIAGLVAHAEQSPSTMISGSTPLPTTITNLACTSETCGDSPVFHMHWFLFDPKPDITTQELADFLRGMHIQFDKTAVDHMPESVRRHLREEP